MASGLNVIPGAESHLPGRRDDQRKGAGEAESGVTTEASSATRASSPNPMRWDSDHRQVSVCLNKRLPAT